MEQLTKEQAIAFYDSGIWKAWSEHEIAEFQLYQNRICVPFDTFHRCITVALNRPVYTHEFMNVRDLRAELLGNKEAPTLADILNLIPEDKRIIIFQNDKV